MASQSKMDDRASSQVRLGNLIMILNERLRRVNFQTRCIISPRKLQDHLETCPKVQHVPPPPAHCLILQSKCSCPVGVYVVGPATGTAVGTGNTYCSTEASIIKCLHACSVVFRLMVHWRFSFSLESTHQALALISVAQQYQCTNSPHPATSIALKWSH